MQQNTAEITTWKTKDGRTLKITEMEDNHLINTICFLKRRGFINHRTWSTYFSGKEPNGEGALDAFNAEADYVLSFWPSASLTALEAEATRRGLDWEPRIRGEAEKLGPWGGPSIDSFRHTKHWFVALLIKIGLVSEDKPK